MDPKFAAVLQARRERRTQPKHYFATLRVVGDDDKLHRTARTEDFMTLGEARTNLDAMMSSADGKQEGSVGTIFRVGPNGTETIEHAVTVNGEVRQAYRSKPKWYLIVAPFIRTSLFYHKTP
jgi:hypothetical protein